MADTDYIQFTEKYRPRRFEDVVGQVSAIETLKHFVRDRNTSSVIAIGPPGTGKTSLMRIFSNAMSCEAADPSPCGKCDTCRLFNAPDLSPALFHHYEFSGSLHREHETGTMVARLNQEHFNRRFGIFIDEVHGLKAIAADALLKAVEYPRPGTFFMFATTEPSAVRPALRSRCIDLNLHPLSEDQSFALLKRICDAEGIIWDNAALEMLVVAGGGSARELVKLLDRTSQQGPLTAALMSKALSLGWVVHLLDYFDSLLSANVHEQEDALSRWLEPARNKAKAIRNFLIYIHNFEVMKRGRVIDPAFYQVTEAQRSALVRKLKPRAVASRMDMDEYLMELAERWRLDPATFPDDNSLSIQLRRFNRLVNPPTLEIPAPAQEPTLPVIVQPSRNKRLRSARAFNPVRPSSSPQSKGFLSLAQVEAVYDAASFLPQQYGKLFNAHLFLDHHTLGSAAPKEAADLISRLTHQIGQRVHGWSGAEAHWLYLNTASAHGPITDILMHLPDEVHARAEAWFNKVIGLWRGALPDESNKWALSIDPVRAARARMKLHWKLVRGLWRGVDPETEHWTSPARERRMPLLDVLRVPRQGRGSIGETALRRFGTSSTIGPDARAKAENNKMKLLSAFVDCAWNHLDTGWELQEVRERQAEIERRRRSRAYLDERYPETRDVLAARHREQAIAELNSSWPADPRLRRRDSSNWQWW